MTRERGVALFMHYSGVWDDRAVAMHPGVGRRSTATASPSKRATSVFGPYVDELMIPQLRELAGEYGVDGVWVDGDCWGTMPDYGEAAVREFCEQTGAEAAPRKSGRTALERVDGLPPRRLSPLRAPLRRRAEGSRIRTSR